MKFIAFTLLLISLSGTAYGQKITPENVDFKKISAAATRTVVIKNNTNSPLVIRTIKADCNCVSVQFSRQPILAADSTAISVTYSPKSGESGFFYKVVYVHFATQKTPAEFALRGVVVAK